MSLAPRYRGRLDELSREARAELVERARAEADPGIEERVRAILARVRRERDAALLALTKELDRVEAPTIAVPPEACARALSELDPAVRRGLEHATENLERVHRAFLPTAVEVESEPGVVVGRRPDALAAVGVYAPGGRAAYPSSVLMGVVPARVAGVRDVVVTSPPGPGGLPSPVVLAAAAISGASRVLALGGAQAIGALAYGTESVPKVDRIVGPGNAYVAEAKRQVAGVVGIDAPAGPSEILVIADREADAARIAHELVAQAEHDPEASCVALCQGEALAARVLAELARIEPSRRDLVEASLSSRGAVLSIDELTEAYAFAEAYAAEHLLLAVRDPDAELAHVRHAGTVFLGEAASVAFGDYLTGANHVLPTAGAARSYSGLSTLDFIRWTTWQRVSPQAARAMERDVVALAESEGLHAHAEAARSAAAWSAAALGRGS